MKRIKNYPPLQVKTGANLSSQVFIMALVQNNRWHFSNSMLSSVNLIKKSPHSGTVYRWYLVSYLYNCINIIDLKQGKKRQANYCTLPFSNQNIAPYTTGVPTFARKKCSWRFLSTLTSQRQTCHRMLLLAHRLNTIIANKLGCKK